MKAIFKKLSDNKSVLAAGGLSLFIILLVYFCFEIIPFGDKTVYRMDLYHQYGPLFSELYDRLTSGGSLLYSWNTGLGSSFLGNFFNYLSSPFSFFILLFGHDNTFEAIAAMIAAKAVMSAMSMTYFLKKSRGSNNYSAAAFGILYSFCGYFIAYYWNVMWIDSLYILPFIALGIENIINKGKSKTFIFSLALAIITNYYIGYMLCIFSCIYFVYYYICALPEIKKKKLYTDCKGFKNKFKNSFFLKSGIRFAFGGIIAVLALTAMLLPLANILRTSSATTGSAPTELKFYFNIFDFVANHLASLEPTIRSSGEDVLPNIYCGILTVLLIPLYFFSKRINYAEKIASAVLLAFMYFSFSLNYLNFIWHGFHFPNDLPYRQSFMYSFMLILLAYKAFKNIHEFSRNQLIAIGTAVIAFIVIAQKIGSKNVTDTTVYISVALVFAYIILLALIISKKAQAAALSIVLLCTTASEMILASTEHYVANQTKAAYTTDYDDFKELQKVIDDGDDDLFYRTELSYLRARMDPSWYNYDGVSIFSSMAYEKVANLQKYIGLYGNKINSFTYNPQTPVYNSMFSLKYIYDRSSKIGPGDYYSFKASSGVYSVYENDYYLSLAYPVSENILNWDASVYTDPVTAQEELFSTATGVEGVFERIYDYEVICGNVLSVTDEAKYAETLQLSKISDDFSASATVEINTLENKNYYVYIYSRNLDTVTVYSPEISTTMTVSDGYILDLGYHSAGETISIELPLKSDVDTANVDFTLFTVNKDKFVEGYNSLAEGQLNITRFEDTLVEGTYTADENEILFTSIPYDNGWTVYVDGKKVSEENIVKISDALIGIKTTEGEHEIVFSYSPAFLKGSIIFSAVFIIVLLIIYVLVKRRWFIFKKIKPSLWERCEKTLREAEKSASTPPDDDDIIIEFDDGENNE